MAASKETEAVAVVGLQGEAAGRDTIGGLQGRSEGVVIPVEEETEEGRVTAVVDAEAAEEGGVGDEAAPALADGGGAGEGGRLRGEAEEDLGEEVVVVQRRRRPRAEESGRHVERRKVTLPGSSRVLFLCFNGPIASDIEAYSFLVFRARQSPG